MQSNAKRLWIAVACLLIVGMFLGLISHESTISLGGSETIHIRPAPLLSRALRTGVCQLEYGRGTAQPGHILLTDNWTDFPIIVIPTENRKSFLCLFKLEDMGSQLIRFDTETHFEPLPAFPSDKHLNEIVRSSGCKVEVGTLDDFKYVCDFVKSNSPGDLRKYTVRSLTVLNASKDKAQISHELDGIALNWNALH